MLLLSILPSSPPPTPKKLLGTSQDLSPLSHETSLALGVCRGLNTCSAPNEPSLPGFTSQGGLWLSLGRSSGRKGRWKGGKAGRREQEKVAEHNRSKCAIPQKPPKGLSERDSLQHIPHPGESQAWQSSPQNHWQKAGGSPKPAGGASPMSCPSTSHLRSVS